MPNHTVDLIVTSTDGSKRDISADFDHSEWIALEMYLSDVAKLCECSLVKNAFPYNIQVKHDFATKSREVTGSLPPDDDFELFVYRLRKFFLDKEPVFFPTIRNLLSRKLVDEEVRDGLKFLKQQFHKFPFTVKVRAGQSTTTITSHGTLLTWLNSELFHHHEDKKELFQRVFQEIPEDASRAVFGMMLNEKARAIINLANFTRVVLGEQSHYCLGDRKTPGATVALKSIT